MLAKGSEFSALEDDARRLIDIQERLAGIEAGKQICDAGGQMPEKAVTERAKKDLEEGKSPSTAAGEFVREEIEHVREGKHGARSPEQAIAIGLSKARHGDSTEATVSWQSERGDQAQG